MGSINRMVGGIVLCGGRSTRMGRPKEWLSIGKEFLLQRMVRVVSEVVASVIVAARHEQELPPLPQEVEVVRDAVENFGPLAGMAAGLAALAATQGGAALGHATRACEAAFVASCDHPLLKTAVVARLIESLGDHPAVVVQDGDRLFPLLGVYRLSVRSVVEDLISRGEHRARRLAEKCGAHFISSEVLRELDPQLLSLRNVNDPSDLDFALRALKADG